MENEKNQMVEKEPKSVDTLKIIAIGAAAGVISSVITNKVMAVENTNSEDGSSLNDFSNAKIVVSS